MWICIMSRMSTQEKNPPGKEGGQIEKGGRRGWKRWGALAILISKWGGCNETFKGKAEHVDAIFEG